MISDAEIEIKLRDRLFYRVLKTLRDIIRHLYDEPAVTFTQLLDAVWMAEAEVGHGKLGTMTVKDKAATADDELASYKQVTDLVAVVKANQGWGKAKEATAKQNSSNNRNQANKGSQIFGGNGQQSIAVGPSKNNQVPHQCYKCWWWGHMA